MRLAAVLAWAAIGAAGCAAPSAARAPVAPPDAPRAASAPSAPSSRSAAPPAASARYGVESDVAPTALEASAIEVARERLAVGRARPRVSGALVSAARELARAAADGEPDALTRGRIRAALARAAAWDPAPTAVLVAADGASARGAISRAIAGGRATHVGAGAAVRGDRAFVVVLSEERKVTIDPFPRDVAPGDRPVLSGRLAAGLARPRVFVGLPSGRVDEVEAGPGPGFRAPVAFSARGRYAVEVVAEGAGGPEVTALLAVSAGGAPLETAAVPPEEDPPAAPAAEAAVLRAVNATRRRHGLTALSPSPALAAIARAHSAAMAAAGAVAHVLPGSGDAGARLRAARVPYRRVLENVAVAPSAIAAHRATEESPAHLAALLDVATTQVGVGIGSRKLPSGDDAVYLTEVFVERADDGAESSLTADARVREALWAERARLRLPPLTADAALDALAREAAAEMRGRGEPGAPELADRALALRRGLAAADVFVASAPSDARRSGNLADRRFRRVGVGVVTGDSRRFGAGRFWIAVVYTD